jgi:hypothetical protein
MLSISKNKVPRDWNRPPKPIPSLKSGNAPQRNVRKGNKRYYRPPITKN